MTRRRLSPDEVELWRKVADTAQRMHPDRPSHDAPKPKPKPHKTPKGRFAEFTVGQTVRSVARHDLAPGIEDEIARQPVKMDAKAFGRMKRGKMEPEARIDLHGMTLDHAHPALTNFILRSHARGLRLVLVITGKGKDRDEGGPIPTRRGVLKHQVPQWLKMAPLAGAVLQVAQAHQGHGGGGAYYVYLRRHR